MSERLPTWRIASPCDVRWDQMDGDDHVRRCGRCDENVFSLSTLSRTEAEELLERTAGQVCTTFYQRTDGTVLTADCPEARWQALRRRVSSATAVAAASLLSLWTTVAPSARDGRIAQTLGVLADPPPIDGRMTGGAPPPMPHPIVPPKPQPKPKPKQ